MPLWVSLLFTIFSHQTLGKQKKNFAQDIYIINTICNTDQIPILSKNALDFF